MAYVVELNMLMSTKQRVTRRTILGDHLMMMMIIMVMLMMIIILIVLILMMSS